MIGDSHSIPKRKMSFMVQCSQAWGLPLQVAQTLNKAIEESTKSDAGRSHFNKLYSDIQRTAEDQCYSDLKNERGRRPREDELNKKWSPLKNAGISMEAHIVKNRFELS